MVSIVMTYFNRPNQLLITLNTIKHYSNSNVEIIIVDDASDLDKSAGGIISKVDGLDIKLVTIEKQQKFWVNPCVPYNIGFRRASGDVIFIQNAECLHFGNLIEYAINHIDDDNYLTFSCYSLTKDQYIKLLPFIAERGQYLIDGIQQIIHPLVNRQWYNHEKYKPSNYHFASVLTKKNLDRIGGFNEEFAGGYCWEDNEFLLRIKGVGLKSKIVPIDDCGFVIHQWHEKGSLHGGCKEWHRNKGLYEKILKG